MGSGRDLDVLLMARIVDESFEGTGYEETWVELVDTGCTVDEDSSIPGTPPIGIGSQCLNSIVTDATNNDASTLQTKTNQNISYIRGYLYVSAEGFSNNQGFATLNIQTTTGTLVARIDILQLSGVLSSRFVYWSSGAQQATAGVAISLNTWYRIEYQYDTTNLLWEWRINGVTQHSGVLAATTGTPDRLRIGIIGNTGTTGATMYTDRVAWDDTEWVGAEGHWGAYSQNTVIQPGISHD